MGGVGAWRQLVLSVYVYCQSASYHSTISWIFANWAISVKDFFISFWTGIDFLFWTLFPFNNLRDWFEVEPIGSAMQVDNKCAYWRKKQRLEHNTGKKIWRMPCASLSYVSSDTPWHSVNSWQRMEFAELSPDGKRRTKQCRITLNRYTSKDHRTCGVAFRAFSDCARRGQRHWNANALSRYDSPFCQLWLCQETRRRSCQRSRKVSRTR